MDDGLMDEYFIQYRNAPRIFRVFNTVSGTQRANRMGYKKVMETFARLNYEEFSIGNKRRLRKIKKEQK